MGDMRVITPVEYDLLNKVHNGGCKFKLKVPLPGIGPTVTLFGKQKPYSGLYEIIIGRQIKVVNMSIPEQEVATYSFSNMEFQKWQEFWITWHYNKLKMGLIANRKPFFTYKINSGIEIGYVQFHTLSKNWVPVEWEFETPPVIPKPIILKVIENNLCWRPMENGILPLGAMIGGFEDEPTYIARAQHENSLCPGKYVPSLNKAFIPWNQREHVKTEFEILCGYNAMWEETHGDLIPLNAFVGGQSEAHHLPLYIGRAFYDKKLIVGKVHVLHKKCYLPFNGKEIETNTYEVLVIPQTDIPQAIRNEN